MITDFNSVLSQAIALPFLQRYELTQRLLESFDADGDEVALVAELERRIAEMDAGTVRTYSHDEVMREAGKAEHTGR